MNSLQLSMFFIFRQLEKFTSINFIDPVYYKSFSAVLILGVFFIILVLIIFFFLKNKDFRKVTIIALLICWSPLFLNGYYNQINDFLDNLIIINKPLQEKRIIYFCALDKNQNLRGSVCGLPFFVDRVLKTIKPGAKLKLISNPEFAIYINYQLEDKYKMVKEIAQADYLLFYFTNEPYSLKNNILYKKEDNNKYTNFGKYELYKMIADRIVILKKIKD